MYSLVHKELTGQLNKDESLELKRLRVNNQSEAISEDIAAIWSASKEYIPTKDWKKAEAKEALLKRIRTEGQPQGAIKDTGATSNLSNYIAIGAAIVLLTVGAFYFLNRTNDAPSDAQEALIEYAMLDDNSKLWIGEGSKVIVASFSDAQRNVALEGEAIFDVARDETRPFVIDLGNDVYAQVLGTSFKATSTHRGSVGSIAVREGRVRLYSTTNPDLDMVLGAGEYGSIDPLSKEANNSAVTAPIVLELEEDISFQNTPLSDVFESLSKFYGVEIKVDASVDCKITSPLAKNSSLQHNFDVLLTSYEGLTVRESERSTYIVSGTCH